MKRRPVGVILWSLFFILLGAYCLLLAQFTYSAGQGRLNSFLEHKSNVCQECPPREGPFLKLYKASREEYRQVLEALTSMLPRMFIIPILLVICGIFCVWSGVGVFLFRETARKLMTACPLILMVPMILIPNAAIWQTALFGKMVHLELNLSELLQQKIPTIYGPVRDPWKDIIQVDLIVLTVCAVLFCGVLFYFTRPQVKEQFAKQIHT